MYLFSLCISVIVFIYSIELVSPVSVRLVDTSFPKSPILRMSAVESKPGLRSEGIFERFLRNYLHMLSRGLTGKQLIKYCRMVSKELKKMEFTYTERLSKHYRRLSRMYREDLESEMEQYRKQLEEKLPHRQNFLQAMNEVFTLQQNLRFDDYNHDLLDFANGHKLSMQEETRKLLNDVIVNSIDKLSNRDQRILEKKLRLAIKEYNSDL